SGMADMNCVFQVQMAGHCSEVIGIMIHVMAFADLSGSAMASAIMRNDAIPALEEEQHLSIPIVGRKRPAMAEHDWLALAPVFVKDFYAFFCFNHPFFTPTFRGFF